MVSGFMYSSLFNIRCCLDIGRTRSEVREEDQITDGAIGNVEEDHPRESRQDTTDGEGS